MTLSGRIRRALISVYDKTDLVPLAAALSGEFGVEIISTGGTAAALAAAGVPVTPVERITGFSQMLDGRVKTLDARLHAAILADRDNPDHLRQLAAQGIEPIDMVVVNLYPFARTIADPGCRIEQAVEMIDIGGPCLLRAAAKNHRHVLVVSSPRQYAAVLEAFRRAGPTLAAVDCKQYAAEAFWLTSIYDGTISQWLDRDTSLGESRRLAVHLELDDATAYGENPHQRGCLWRSGVGMSGLSLRQALVGGATVPLSFNNCADASAALELCVELTRAGNALVAATRPGGAGRGPSVAVFVKHANPCGVGVHPDPLEAYRRAYLGDPTAAMGGILAVNFGVEAAFAEAVMETYQRWGRALKDGGAPQAPGGFFVEVWVAPVFDAQAVEVIRSRKEWGRRVRLIAVGDLARVEPEEPDFRRLFGGILTQGRDRLGLEWEKWQSVGSRQPTPEEAADLSLAWLVCKHTRSNAVTICRDGMLIGNGAGQMSRVMSCRIAVWLAEANGHGQALRGASAGSDGFFPFADGPQILADAGVRAIIQPGGSKNDAGVIEFATRRDLVMILTGTRHFRH
jgi:phosphoribosylaminoimidazolecarboxamide formyltransferase/IMP cyclohydrolase